MVIGVASGNVRPTLPPVVLLFGVAVVALVPAVILAGDGQAAWAVFLEHLKDLWFLLVVAVLAASVSSALSLAKVTASVMALLAALSLLREVGVSAAGEFAGLAVVSDSLGEGTATARHQGAFDDPNFYGRLLVLALPLALSLAADGWARRSRAAVLGWGSAVAAMTGAVYLTQSRGAMLGLVVVVVVWLVATGPPLRRALWVAPLLVVALLAVPGVGSRLASLTDLTPQGFEERDYSLVERSAAQQVMLAIFTDNPVSGVGPGNIPEAWSDYMGAAKSGLTREVAPHNLYLQLLAESGVVGFLGWFVFLGGVVMLCVRRIGAHPVRGFPSEHRLVAAGALAGVAGWCTVSLVLHLSFLRPLLVVAVVAQLVLLTRDDRFGQLSAPPPEVVKGSWRPAVAVGVTVALAVASVPVGQEVLRRSVWVAQVPITLVPSRGDDLYPDFYRRTVVSDRSVIATYGAVVDRVGRGSLPEHSNLELTVTGTGLDDTMFVRVEGRSRQDAEDVAVEIAGRGNAFIHTHDGLAGFAVTRVGDVESFRAERWVFAG
jgi:O-antigen ligase